VDRKLHSGKYSLIELVAIGREPIGPRVDLQAVEGHQIAINRRWPARWQVIMSKAVSISNTFREHQPYMDLFLIKAAEVRALRSCLLMQVPRWSLGPHTAKPVQMNARGWARAA
jgi:hypothetical protein